MSNCKHYVSYITNCDTPYEEETETCARGFDLRLCHKCDAYAEYEYDEPDDDLEYDEPDSKFDKYLREKEMEREERV